jgi:uncharacterized protein (UPF0333 family)
MTLLNEKRLNKLYKKNPITGEFQAQGAIEYLLLLAASVVVVAIVITFLMNSLRTGTETGSEQTYDYLCNTLNSDTNTCKCYRGEIAKVDCCANETIGDDLKKILNCN